MSVMSGHPAADADTIRGYLNLDKHESVITRDRFSRFSSDLDISVEELDAIFVALDTDQDDVICINDLLLQWNRTDESTTNGEIVYTQNTEKEPPDNGGKYPSKEFNTHDSIFPENENDSCKYVTNSVNSIQNVNNINEHTSIPNCVSFNNDSCLNKNSSNSNYSPLEKPHSLKSSHVPVKLSRTNVNHIISKNHKIPHDKNIHTFNSPRLKNDTKDSDHNSQDHSQVCELSEKDRKCQILDKNRLSDSSRIPSDSTDFTDDSVFCDPKVPSEFSLVSEECVQSTSPSKSTSAGSSDHVDGVRYKDFKDTLSPDGRRHSTSTYAVSSYERRDSIDGASPTIRKLRKKSPRPENFHRKRSISKPLIYTSPTPMELDPLSVQRLVC